MQTLTITTYLLLSLGTVPFYSGSPTYRYTPHYAWKSAKIALRNQLIASVTPTFSIQL
jgi:hypothetical protein